jgi:uncharacterized protein YjbJ (UPF0337 family)
MGILDKITGRAKQAGDLTDDAEEVVDLRAEDLSRGA